MCHSAEKGDSPETASWEYELMGPEKQKEGILLLN